MPTKMNAQRFFNNLIATCQKLCARQHQGSDLSLISTVKQKWPLLRILHLAYKLLKSERNT